MLDHFFIATLLKQYFIKRGSFKIIIPMNGMDSFENVCFPSLFQVRVIKIGEIPKDVTWDLHDQVFSTISYRGKSSNYSKSIFKYPESWWTNRIITKAFAQREELIKPISVRKDVLIVSSLDIYYTIVYTW